MVAPGVFPRRSLHPAARQTLLRASITNRLLTPRLVTLAAIRGNGKRAREERPRDRQILLEGNARWSFFSHASSPAPTPPSFHHFRPPPPRRMAHCCDFYIYIYIFDGFPQFDELTTREYSKYRRVCIQQGEEGGGGVKFLEMARACVHSVHSLLR